MGTHYRHNIQYGGAMSQIIPISQADYDALSEEEKMRNVIYAINNSLGLELMYKGKPFVLSSDASMVEYEDGSVKDALDGINENIAHLTSDITFGSLVNLANYTQSSPYTIPSDGYVYASASYDSSNCMVSAIDANGVTMVLASGCYKQGAWGTTNSCFVKKGLKVYKSWSEGSLWGCGFRPINISE